MASLSRPLRRARPAWALDLSQNPFDNGRRHLEDALHRCFKGPSAGFPAFHKRGSNEAGEAGAGHPERIRMDGRNIRLPKVGRVIRAEPRPDHDGGRPLQVHVPAGRGARVRVHRVRLRHGPSRTVRPGAAGRG